MLKTRFTLRNLVTVRVSVLSIAVLLVMFSVVAPVAADVMEVFKMAAQNAKGKKGCESIPFSSDSVNWRGRTECFAIQKDMHEYCAKRIADCKFLLGIKQRLIESIPKAEEQVKFLENKKAGIKEKLERTNDPGEKKKYEEELARVEEDIRSQQETVASIRKQVAEFNAKSDYRINDAIDQADRCLKMRQGVQDLFNDVLERLKRVRDYESYRRELIGNNATKERHEELRGYASEIITYIESEIGRHKNAEEEYKSWIANCKEVLDKKE